MRLSRLFFRTLRESPADAEMASHRLLLRAGFIHQLGAGIFTLPLGRRATDRLETILREEIDAIGGQKLTMPVVNPADVWKETGRYQQVGAEMARFADRGGRDMVLAMTHEEVVGTVTRDLVQSYRQLPRLVYHIQTKWRDDPRPRAGLIRAREFTMKDSYSLDADEAGMDRQYEAHQVATVVEDGEERERFVFAVVRGDMELSETKLRNAVGSKELRPATDAEIRAAGAVPGYASPIGLADGADVVVVVDDLIAASPNLVAGANEEGVHLRNVSYGRDFEADLVTDLVAAGEGSPCPECGEPMDTRRGVEVGNIFKLGTRYSNALGCTYLDADGKERPIWMGSYGIGSGRLLACVAEENHDENGLVWPVTVAPWPVTVAPWPVHVVALGGGEEEAGRIHETLTAAGIDVLWDDRDESAGVKFNDADLLGMPVRLTVSGRSLERGGVEVKLRAGEEVRIVPLDDLLEEVESVLAELAAHLTATVEEEIPPL